MEWKEVTIGSISEGIYEGPHATPPKADKGGIYLGIPNITSSGRIDLSNPKYISESDMPKWNQRVTPQEGDVLFSNEATLNLYALIPKGFYGSLGRRIALIRPKRDLVIPEFLYYYFFSKQWRELIEKEKFSGATVERISMIRFPNYKIFLPPLPTQRRISSILSSLDRKIELNNQINKQLEEMAQAIFKSWFIDFEPFKDGEFVDSELGRIPKGWRVGTLEHLVEVKYGKDHKKLKAGCYPVYGSGGYMRSVDQHLYEGESVLIPRKGTLNNIMYVNESFWTVDTMFYTKPKVDSVLKYVHQHLLLIDFERMNEGTSIPSTTTATLNGLKIIIPSRSILKEYDDVLASIYNKIKQNKAENTHLSTLRDTLLPKLMSGEINLEQYGNQ